MPVSYAFAPPFFAVLKNVELNKKYITFGLEDSAAEMLSNETEQRESFLERNSKRLLTKDILLGTHSDILYYAKFSYAMYLITLFVTLFEYLFCYLRRMYSEELVIFCKIMNDMCFVAWLSKEPIHNRSVDCRRAFFNIEMAYEIILLTFQRYDAFLFVSSQFSQAVLQMLLIHVPFATSEELAYLSILGLTTYVEDYLFFEERNIAILHVLMIILLVIENYIATQLNNFVLMGDDAAEEQNQISCLFSTLVRNSIPHKVYKQICEDEIPCTHNREDSIIVLLNFLTTEENDEIFAAKCELFTFLIDKLCGIVGMLKVKSGFLDYIAITDKFVAYGGILEDITRKELFNQAAIFCQFVLEVSRVVDFQIKLIMTVGDINFYVNGFQKCFIWCNVAGPGIEKARSILSELERGVYLDHTSIQKYCGADDVAKASKKAYTFEIETDEMHIITSFIRKNEKPPKLFAPRTFKSGEELYEIVSMDLTIEAKELFSKVLEMMLVEKTRSSTEEDAIEQSQKEIKMMLDNVDSISIRQSSSIEYSCTSCDVSEQLSVKLGFEMSSDESDDINRDFAEFTEENIKNAGKRLSARRPNLETVEENENDSNLRAFLEKYRRYIDSLELKQNVGVFENISSSESRLHEMQTLTRGHIRYWYLLKRLLRILKFESRISEYARSASENCYFQRGITSNYSLFFLAKIPFCIAVILILLKLNGMHNEETHFIMGWELRLNNLSHSLLLCLLFSVVFESYILFAIEKQKIIEHEVNYFDDRIYLCSSLHEEETDEPNGANFTNVTIYNRLHRILLAIEYFVLHGVGISEVIISISSIYSFGRKVSIFMIAFVALYRQEMAICQGSPYFMSVYDISYLFFLGILIDIFCVSLVSLYDFYYGSILILISGVHFINNAFLLWEFCRYALINQGVLEKSEKYARKLECFQLPVTIQTILYNEMQLAQLRSFNFPVQLIKHIALCDIQTELIRSKSHEINRRRERLINEIGVSEASDEEKLEMENLNIEQELISHEKELLLNPLNQRVLLAFNSCFALNIRLEGLEELEISQQTELMSVFFDAAKEQVDNIETCFIYVINGSSIGIIFFEETGARFEFYNQLQLAVATGLGIMEFTEVEIQGICADEGIYLEKALTLKAAIAHGSCIGSVLGDQIYRFDIIGQLVNTIADAIQHAEIGAVCAHRELIRKYEQDDLEFEASVKELDQGALRSERIQFETKCSKYEYVEIYTIK